MSGVNMGSDIESNQTAQICHAASQDRSPMAIDFGRNDADGASRSSEEIVKIAVHVAEADVIGGARQILAVLRPTWSSENIRFKVGGYDCCVSVERIPSDSGLETKCTRNQQLPDNDERSYISLGILSG